MARNQVVQAFPVDEKPAETEVVQAPVQFIAEDETMTTYGMTVAQIIEVNRVECERIANESAAKDETITAKEAKIVELVEYGKKKNAMLQEVVTADQAKAVQVAELGAKIDSLTIDLGVARMLAKQAKASSVPAGIERLPGGGIRLAVTLDVDEAAPLLSWAESAGEDPAEYIAKTLKDAMVMVVSS